MPLDQHNFILNVGNQLGYFSGNALGCCHGMALRWIEACLTDDESTLNHYVDVVSNDQDLLKKIQLVKEKVQRRELLTNDDLDLFDILGFFESIKLYQDACEYPRLFDSSLSQRQIELTSQFASSTKSTAQGGLVEVYSEPAIYNRSEMELYFNNLSDTIKQAGYSEDTKLGVIVGDFNHTIGLTYQVGCGQWRCMDINQWPSQLFKNTSDLVSHILVGFNRYKKDISSPYTAFNTMVITTGHDALCAQLMTRLNDFKNSHMITQEIARRQELVNLAHIAAQNGHAYVFDALHAIGEDLNTPARDEDGNTPLYIAASMNETAIIAILAEYGVDINTPINNGLTPVYIAAQRGRMEAIIELARRGANVDAKALCCGNSPVYIAAQLGHMNIITVLADFNADLNAAMNDGTTPVFAAAYFGQLDALKLLADRGAELTCYANTIFGLCLTPIYIAALGGHTAIVSELAGRNVPVDEIMFDGTTALFIAAQMGHASIVSDLLTRGANGNITLPYNGSTPLLIASLNGHSEVVRVLLQHACLSKPLQIDVNYLSMMGGEEGRIRAEKWMHDKVGTDAIPEVIEILPFEIAFIIGHEDVLGVFHELVPDQIVELVMAHEPDKKETKSPKELSVIPSDLESATAAAISTQLSFKKSIRDLRIKPESMDSKACMR